MRRKIRSRKRIPSENVGGIIGGIGGRRRNKRVNRTRKSSDRE